MSIIIEDIDDIELLISFFKRFNISKENNENNSTDVLTELKETVTGLIASVTELNSEMENYVTKEDVLAIVQKTIEQEFSNHTLSNTKKEPVTIRTYRKKYSPFLITGLNKDGTFNQQKGKPISFTIQDVLKLQKLIPKTKEYPSFKSLSEEMGLCNKTIIKLSYLIENGEMDNWLRKWEQIEADNFYGKYGNWKPNFENNPQKRKEQGMV